MTGMQRLNREAGEVGRIQVIWDSVDHFNAQGFYSKNNGKPIKGSKWGSEIIKFAFKKCRRIEYGKWIEKGQESMQ